MRESERERERERRRPLSTKRFLVCVLTVLADIADLSHKCVTQVCNSAAESRSHACGWLLAQKGCLGSRGLLVYKRMLASTLTFVTFSNL